MTFLAPLLLSGLALGSVPIIIHLLNRRRFIRLDWAPMKYLKLTLKSNRRRLRLEQWLLLAVRTLAVLVLFFAVARPVVSRVGAGGWLAGRTRTSRLLVIDDSLSMALQGTTNSAMSRAKEAAVSLIEAVGTQDSLTVLTTSAPRLPLLRHAHLENPEDLAATLRAIEPKHTANDWAATFGVVSEHLASAEFPIKQVTLVTDMRAQGWDTQVTEQMRAWADEGVTLSIVDVGQEPAGNMALIELLQQDAAALVDIPLRLMARVRNDGSETIASPQAVLSVDGVEQTVVLPDVPAGGEADVPITVTLDAPGVHGVAFTLPDDALALDNRRWLSVDARRSVSATLVDGEPGSRPFESEADFLALALSAGRSPWRVRLVDDSQWLNSPMTAPDVLVLANVTSIPEARAQKLREMVRAGMGLIVFPGGQVDVQAYERLVVGADSGFLPGRIVQINDEPASGLVLEPLADSPLSAMKMISAEALASIRPKRIAELVPVTDTADDVTTRVLATWNNAAQSPAVIEARIGQGRVLLWSISADRAFSDWPIDPSYVLAMRESALALAGRPDPGRVLTAGQPIRQQFDPQRAPATVRLTAPGRPESVSLAVAARGENGSDAPSIEHDATAIAGVYELAWDEPGVGSRTELFSVNPDVRESELAPLKPERLTSLLGELQATVIPFGEASGFADAQGAELWRQLVLALLVLIGVETLLAAWVTREH